MTDIIVTSADKLDCIIKIIGYDMDHNSVDKIARIIDRNCTISSQYVSPPSDFFCNTYNFCDNSETTFAYDLV